MRPRSLIDLALVTLAAAILGGSGAFNVKEAQAEARFCSNTDCDGAGDCEFKLKSICALKDPKGSGCAVVSCQKE